MTDFENAMDFCPRSILDTDLCKLTMQQAVLQHFPKHNVTYKFINWSEDMLFSRECFEMAKESIQRLSELRLTPKEAEWLRNNSSYFTEDYISYLTSYRFRPNEQVKVEFHVTSEPGASVEQGCITVDIAGLWADTILYEVPLLCILSEAFFSMVDHNWTYEGQEELAYEKAKQLVQAGVSFCDFGTRRRRSYHGQDLVLKGLLQANTEFGKEGLQGRLSSTSNPHFAMKYGLSTVGTISHEWIMGIAAVHGYENANSIALDLWEATYPTTNSNVLDIALTDTFSTGAFINSFKDDIERAKRWRGLRQDSGDPHEFIHRARAVYQQLGIDHRKKIIVFSDGLDVESSLEVQKTVDQAGFIGVFGIGTFLMNDYKRLNDGQRSRPLVMVVKIASVEGVPCIKISDDTAKNTGDPEVLSQVKQKFGITT